MRTNQAFLASQKNQDSKTALSKSTRSINQEKGGEAGKQLKQEGGI